jgi:dihydrofolate reductase
MDLSSQSNEKLDFAKTRSLEGTAWMAEKMEQAGAHLMGRKAFCEMAPFWPTAGGVLAKPMNEIPKIVFSKKGFDPSQASSAKSWAEAKVIAGDLAELKFKRELKVLQ